ncbi:MAG TPA: hypothetical protein VES93_16440 [Ornithinibacter sp.]|nr:hypothetical protein [Ornithinibacter sp.]
MFRRTARLTTISAVALGLAAGAALVAAPAQADPVIIGLPPFVCGIVTPNVIVGTEHDDVLFGTPGNDLILAMDGDDHIAGGGGRDVILAGNGDDVVDGGAGDDCVLGGAGNDESIQWLYSAPSGTDDSQSVVYRYEY